MRLLKLAIITALTASLPYMALSAEPATAPEEKEAPRSVGTMPTRGMSMAQVRQYFGEPDKIIKPIGEPPITRWIYEDGFVVFFEYNLVLHALVPMESSK